MTTIEDLLGEPGGDEEGGGVYCAKPGRLESVLPGYSFRLQQWGAAKLFQEGFTQGRHTLVEAPCGVGKGLAYLIPAALAIAEGKVAVVSTHTTALQDQLIGKDIPVIRALMPEAGIVAAALKGRGHYLCLQDAAGVSEDLLKAGEPWFQSVVAWARETKTGERGGLPAPVSKMEWMEVAAKRETCRGKECALLEKCFYYGARRAAETANLIVVNHALLMEDLQMKRNAQLAGKNGKGGRLLPDYDILIIDEAHHLEGVAQEILGVSVREGAVPGLCRRLREARTRYKALVSPGLLSDAEKASEGLFKHFRPENGQASDCFFSDALGEDGLYHAQESAVVLAGRLETLVSELKVAVEAAKNESAKGILTGGARSARALMEDVTALLLTPDRKGDVRWVQVDGSKNKDRLTLRLSPIEVGPLLRPLLWNAGPVCALTSATIATKQNGGFGFLKSRLGLSGFDTLERTLGSPFDFRKNALLYVPAHLPAPPKGYTDEYASLLLGEMERLLGLSSGRAFVLCTSRRSLSLLRDRLEKLRGLAGGYNVVAQGDAPFPSLMRQFRESERGVLLGLASFWEGVDVRGDDLSMVIIDRIPFGVPDSPLTRAASAAIVERGGDWFRDYALPKAQIRLKQGFGRLIRTDTDRGIVAILDSRLANKSYGPRFLKALPPAQRSHTWEEAEAWGRKVWPHLQPPQLLQEVRQSVFPFD